MFSHRFRAFILHVCAWIVFVLVVWLTSNERILLWFLPLIIVDLWYALCLGFMLRLPVARENTPPPDEWIWEEYEVKGYPVRWLKKEIDPSKPLAILIHGWNSRAANMIGRSDLYELRGYNCILFEMRAHGGNKTVPHWAAMHVCHDVETILSVFDERGWLDNGFIVHGHSLGGFVAQRVLRTEMTYSSKARGMILESPVTSYEYINNQTCEFLKIPTILHKPLMRRLLKYYNSLNPQEFHVNSIDFLSTPNWGLPRCSTLLVQSMHDQTLGTIHADLLINVHSERETDFQYHIVEHLKHSHEKKNAHRDNLIEQWMDEQSLFFS